MADDGRSPLGRLAQRFQGGLAAHLAVDAVVLGRDRPFDHQDILALVGRHRIVQRLSRPGDRNRPSASRDNPGRSCPGSGWQRWGGSSGAATPNSRCTPGNAARSPPDGCPLFCAAAATLLTMLNGSPNMAETVMHVLMKSRRLTLGNSDSLPIQSSASVYF